MASDPHNLARFVEAQSEAYDAALEELRRGEKVGHWMWFVFPQLAALGQSMTAKHFGIASLEEARAYLGDPVLGARLVECTLAVNAVEDRTVGEIFGFPDVLKFRSCLTLFAEAAPEVPLFRAAIETHYDGVPDTLTLELLTSA